MIVTVPHALARARAMLVPELERSLARLSPPVRLVVAYHLGFADPEGRPANGDGGKAVRPALALLSAEAAGSSAETALPGALAGGPAGCCFPGLLPVLLGRRDRRFCYRFRSRSCGRRRWMPRPRRGAPGSSAGLSLGPSRGRSAWCRQGGHGKARRLGARCVWAGSSRTRYRRSPSAVEIQPQEMTCGVRRLDLARRFQASRLKSSYAPDSVDTARDCPVEVEGAAKSPPGAAS